VCLGARPGNRRVKQIWEEAFCEPAFAADAVDRAGKRVPGFVAAWFWPG